MKYVVLDASSLICRCCFGELTAGNEIVDTNGNSVVEIFACIRIATYYLNNGIVPIFVFDGASPEAKQNTVQKRRNQRQKARQELDKIHNESSTDEDEELIEVNNVPGSFEENVLINMLGTSTNDEHDVVSRDHKINVMRKSFSPSRKNMDIAKTLLRMMGIPIVESPYEADSQCAALAHYYKNDIAGVVTDDFDVLLFGAEKMIKSCISGALLNEYSLSDVLNKLNNDMIELAKKNPKIDPSIKIDRNSLIELCCMMGTDYGTDAITISNMKIGFAELFNLYLTNGRTFEGVLRYINIGETDMKNEEAMKKVQASYKNYLERLAIAKNEYTNATVLDPKVIDIKMKKPKISLVREEASKYIDAKCLENVLDLLLKTYLAFCKTDNFIINPSNAFNNFSSCHRQYVKVNAKKGKFTDYNSEQSSGQTSGQTLGQSLGHTLGHALNDFHNEFRVLKIIPKHRKTII